MKKDTIYEVCQIAYTAALLVEVSHCTGIPLFDVAEKLGPEGVGRLIHNAPMNRLISTEQVINEIVWKYSLPFCQCVPSSLDELKWIAAANRVKELSAGKAEFGQNLIRVLQAASGANGR